MTNKPKQIEKIIPKNEWLSAKDSKGVELYGFNGKESFEEMGGKINECVEAINYLLKKV